jgi:F-type H+-transporting ATPase subunit O
LQRLEAAVSKSEYVGQGKKLKVTNKVCRLQRLIAVSWLKISQVSSDILGGLIVEIGDRTIDLSVSARIAKMNKLLTDTL